MLAGRSTGFVIVELFGKFRTITDEPLIKGHVPGKFLGRQFTGRRGLIVIYAFDTFDTKTTAKLTTKPA